jgi:hypothetical protein
MLDRARKDLYGYKITLGDITRRCSAWEQAYAELYGKYEETVNHLYAVSSQCLSLY